MKTLLYTTLISLSLILMACPYEGNVELCTYAEALKTEKTLIGEWVAFHEGGDRDELVIEKGDKGVYFVSHKHYKGSKLDERTKVRAYSTDISGTAVFTLEYEQENKYQYAKHEITGKNEFNLQFIDADYMETNFKPEEEVTGKVLKDFLAEHLSDEKLFTEKMEFYRKHSPEYDKVRIYMEKSGF
ncbi:MAG: hypothetical protein KDD41_11795 [Flavobacteriales bacterium]|nr:hypothetical protein [Flavobacteriales bacterium]